MAWLAGNGRGHGRARPRPETVQTLPRRTNSRNPAGRVLVDTAQICQALYQRIVTVEWMLDSGGAYCQVSFELPEACVPVRLWEV